MLRGQNGGMGYNDKQTERTFKAARRTSGRAASGGVRAKKKLGQHFLTDLSVARRIADSVDACPERPVLEVGPGTGVLSQFLIDKGRPFRAVEIDRESVAYLNKHYPELDVITGDFLTMNLNDVFGGRQFVLTGNYPYDISSQIFFKMLDNRDLIPCCTGMVQREVALRITAKPGTKAYGILSVLLGAWYDCEYLFTVAPGVFCPPPKVESAVIRLTRNAVSSLGCDERLFRRIVRATFNQRRKMLRGSLRQIFNNETMPPETFFQNEIMTRRPEQLAIADFVSLTCLTAAALTENQAL